MNKQKMNTKYFGKVMYNRVIISVPQQEREYSLVVTECS